MTDITPPATIGIGDLARRTGTSVRTIRFYCDTEILQSSRTSGGHRVFDPTVAVDQLLLVRHLRALGLGLAAIVPVVRGERPLAEAITEQRAAVDADIDTMVWRRALLLAAEQAPAVESSTRLAALATVRDNRSAHTTLTGCWQRVLPAIPPSVFARFLAANVPTLPVDAAPVTVLDFAELVELAARPAVITTASQRIWRSDLQSVRDKTALITGIADACDRAAARVLAGNAPSPGPELDMFVDAHAHARGVRDTPAFRKHLAEQPALDRDARRYWILTRRLLGSTITAHQTHEWILTALSSPT
ncbi:MerR family transcriptional regulator [Tsukamurella sp. 8F]|uniref:MerR family transcriptional regulator n=1 Tax=unclassified Tsukamurella TaxID=2633480 RepID=UPI0023BA243D|nr:MULTISPECIES: MerR family transcriptional regulator [unclassified Tsukamurella]MDF0530406.1 MerR family transcriptional regulator [Tsukamurella sp. 8J]MDF0587773.1 MerR family transcriptional regulator [Tsukamurella sp. 8F]